MKTKISAVILSMFVALFGFVNQVSAQLVTQTADKPSRIRDLEGIFMNSIVLMWILAIPFFLFTTMLLGVRYMLFWMNDNPDEELAKVKKQGRQFLPSFLLVFGGYIFIRLMMSLLLLNDPNECFTTALPNNNAIFQFFFPAECAG